MKPTIVRMIEDPQGKFVTRSVENLAKEAWMTFYFCKTDGITNYNIWLKQKKKDGFKCVKVELRKVEKI